jgi:D-methionine transport system substrate-binding protein
MKKIVMLLVGVVCGMLLFFGCSDSKSKASATVEKKSITIATTALAMPEVELGIEDLKKRGYEVNVKVLQDATTMCKAIENGEIDVALHPHKPWMDSYNAGNKTDIAMLTPYIHKNTFGMFSKKYATPEEIPNGAKIIIPQDESNLARSLFMMEQLNFIKLKAGVTSPTDLDIESNDKNVKIFKIHVHQVIASLDDADAAFSATLFAVSNKLDPKYQIATSKDADKFGVGFIIANKNKDTKWAKDILASYTTEKVREGINAVYKGSSIPGF